MAETFRDLTTLRVGGAVKVHLRAATREAFVDGLRTCVEKGAPFLVLGEGSNVLARDEAYQGTVITPDFKTVAYEETHNAVLVTASAGVSWDALVKETVERGLWGLENLSGIPGTVGAAPIQNIGAYGTDVAHTIVSVDVFDTAAKQVRTCSNSELAFGYRTSLLKKERGRYIVLSATFRLSKTPAPLLSYKDVQEIFKDKEPSLANLRESIIDIRSRKFPDLGAYGCAGSFFLNPVLAQQEAAALLARFPDMPHFKEGEGIKVSLAWMLDTLLHAKGMREGGAFVWHKQPLVIATEAHATATDVRTLAARVQTCVFEETHINIVPEVHVL